MLQGASLDFKEAEFGCENELVTARKFEFPTEKLMIPLLLHNRGNEIAVCGPLTSYEGGFDQEASFDRLMPEMLAPLPSGEHHGSRQNAEG